jgi:hypothetical protein
MSASNESIERQLFDFLGDDYRLAQTVALKI